MGIVLGSCDGNVKFTRRHNSTLSYSSRTYKPTSSSQRRLERTVENEVNSGRAKIGLRLPLIFVESTV